jgi:hypothetical protein
MARITIHTLEDAPEGSKALLEDVTRFSPTGRPLNLHGQLAAAPAVFHAYVALRRAPEQHGVLEPRIRVGLMAAAAGAAGNDYVIAITSLLAARSGWSEQEVVALRSGEDTGDERIDALATVARDAARHAGRVGDAAWARALDAGWSVGELADAFSPVALTLFTAWFCNFAETPIDVPVPQPAAG